MSTKSQFYSFRKVLWISLGILAISVAARTVLRLEIGHLHRKAGDALALIQRRSPGRIADAAGMLPPQLGRAYQIQAEVKSQQAAVGDAYKTVAAVIRNGGEHLSEPLSYKVLDAVFDSCWLGEPDAEHWQVEKWLASQDEILFSHVRANYFEVARASEETGEIRTAKQFFERFQHLARSMEPVSTDAEGLETQTDLTFAEVRRRTLAPRHFFRPKALRDIDSGDARRVSDYIGDSDPAIRSLAVLTWAGIRYHDRNFAEVIPFLEQHSTDCGELGIECSFLLGKAYARGGYAQIVPSAGSTGGAPPPMLTKAHGAFQDLRTRLQSDHYLKAPACFWLGLVLSWQQDQKGAQAVWREIVKTYPKTGTAVYARRLVEQEAQ